MIKTCLRIIFLSHIHTFNRFSKCFLQLGRNIFNVWVQGLGEYVNKSESGKAKEYKIYEIHSL